ncbi:hypothetical protein EV175_007612, partial [Coemansia sp. RSA 1933]
MNAFHDDIFNRRASGVFMSGGFEQDKRSSVFAAPTMPKPLFGDNSGGYGAPVRNHQRSSSFGGAQHKHFAYVAGCEICEDYIRCGTDICYHEHRV